MKINDKYKWLARDKGGSLWAFEGKPFKKEGESVWFVDSKSSKELEEIKEIDSTYSFIRWVDEQPTNIEYVKEVIETVDKSHYIRTLDEPEITEEQALNKLAESYPFSADGINGILQAQLAGYSPVSTMKFFQGNEPELPVIPQFVADGIEEVKRKSTSLRSLFGRFFAKPDDGLQDYIKKNEELVVRAFLDGYTVEPPKTHQVFVKFFDNEEYKTELNAEAARELIEFLEANKNDQ